MHSITVLAFRRPCRHSRSTRRTPNFVIPREVAESIFACQRSSRRRQWPWHSTMDTATSRSMTALYGVTVYAVAGDGVVWRDSVCGGG